ncbi:MAG: hypothetical protein A2Y94_05985 [Caldithrix sp. RBG_13_44_9]|nr:MAG: hypothetical protein A2Y94_05985 [Caldithrix sp. RBG_13_44_9]
MNALLYALCAMPLHNTESRKAESGKQFTEHSNFQYTIEHERFLKFECLVGSWQKYKTKEKRKKFTWSSFNP